MSKSFLGEYTTSEIKLKKYFNHVLVKGNANKIIKINNQYQLGKSYDNTLLYLKSLGPSLLQLFDTKTNEILKLDNIQGEPQYHYDGTYYYSKNGRAAQLDFFSKNLQGRYNGKEIISDLSCFLEKEEYGRRLLIDSEKLYLISSQKIHEIDLIEFEKEVNNSIYDQSRNIFVIDSAHLNCASYKINILNYPIEEVACCSSDNEIVIHLKRNYIPNDRFTLDPIVRFDKKIKTVEQFYLPCQENCDFLQILNQYLTKSHLFDKYLIFASFYNNYKELISTSTNLNNHYFSFTDYYTEQGEYYKVNLETLEDYNKNSFEGIDLSLFSCLISEDVNERQKGVLIFLNNILTTYELEYINNVLRDNIFYFIDNYILENLDEQFFMGKTFENLLIILRGKEGVLKYAIKLLDGSNDEKYFAIHLLQGSVNENISADYREINSFNLMSKRIFQNVNTTVVISYNSKNEIPIAKTQSVLNAWFENWQSSKTNSESNQLRYISEWETKKIHISHVLLTIATWKIDESLLIFKDIIKNKVIEFYPIIVDCLEILNVKDGNIIIKELFSTNDLETKKRILGAIKRLHLTEFEDLCLLGLYDEDLNHIAVEALEEIGTINSCRELIISSILTQLYPSQTYYRPGEEVRCLKEIIGRIISEESITSENDNYILLKSIIIPVVSCCIILAEKEDLSNGSYEDVWEEISKLGIQNTRELENNNCLINLLDDTKKYSALFEFNKWIKKNQDQDSRVLVYLIIVLKNNLFNWSNIPNELNVVVLEMISVLEEEHHRSNELTKFLIEIALLELGAGKIWEQKVLTYYSSEKYGKRLKPIIDLITNYLDPVYKIPFLIKDIDACKNDDKYSSNTAIDEKLGDYIAEVALYHLSNSKDVNVEKLFQILIDSVNDEKYKRLIERYLYRLKGNSN